MKNEQMLYKLFYRRTTERTNKFWCLYNLESHLYLISYYHNVFLAYIEICLRTVDVKVNEHTRIQTDEEFRSTFPNSELLTMPPFPKKGVILC